METPSWWFGVVFFDLLTTFYITKRSTRGDTAAFGVGNGIRQRWLNLSEIRVPDFDWPGVSFQTGFLFPRFASNNGGVGVNACVDGQY